MNIRISLLSDEIREDNAAKKLRMLHKRATIFSDEQSRTSLAHDRNWEESDTHKNNLIQKHENMTRT